MIGATLRNARKRCTKPSCAHRSLNCGLDCNGSAKLLPLSNTGSERCYRTMTLGTFAGPIYTIILIVDCLFFMFLEWWMPREDLDYVENEWNQRRFLEV